MRLKKMRKDLMAADFVVFNPSASFRNEERARKERLNDGNEICFACSGPVILLHADVVRFLDRVCFAFPHD